MEAPLVPLSREPPELGAEQLALPPLLAAGQPFDAPAESLPPAAAPLLALREEPVKDGRTALFKRRTGARLPTGAQPTQASAPPLLQLDTPAVGYEPGLAARSPSSGAERGWREPSHTLFRAKSYAKQATRAAGSRAPLWAQIVLAVLFGFVVVAGTALLYRLMT
jgi:hypothetical protein